MNKRIKKRSFTTQYLYKHMQENILQYMILSLIFIVFIIVGVIMFNTSTEEQKNVNIKIVENYISINLKTNNKVDIFKKSLFKNLLIILVIWIFSPCFIRNMGNIWNNWNNWI